MIDERHEELAALYACGLLDGEEKRAFEQALAGNPALRRLVQELQEASAGLAHAAPDAPLPAGLKDRVLRDASHRAEVIRFPRNLWVPWSVAAAVALMAGLIGQTFLKTKRENDGLRAETARLNSAHAATVARVKQLEGEAIALHRAALEAEKFQQLANANAADRDRLQQENLALRERDLFAQVRIGILASLVKESPDALAVAVWDESAQRGMLVTEKLPPLPADKDYQLWIVDAAYPKPVDGGVFHGDESGKQQMKIKAGKAIQSAPKFAVSIEAKGGVSEALGAQGPIILFTK